LAVHGLYGLGGPFGKGAGGHVGEVAEFGDDLCFVGNTPVPEELDEGVGLLDLFVLRAVDVAPDPVGALGVVVEFGGGDMGHRILSYKIKNQSGHYPVDNY
jgi:hypothetical protein